MPDKVTITTCFHYGKDWMAIASDGSRALYEDDDGKPGHKIRDLPIDHEQAERLLRQLAVEGLPQTAVPLTAYLDLIAQLAEAKKTQLDKVREFHNVYGLVVNDKPVDTIPPDLTKLRKNLIREEFEELMEAFDEVDPYLRMVSIADALADLLYVVHGTGVSLGIPLNKIFDEVHESNMSKLDEEGKPIVREDGKILKGPNFREPNLPAILWPVPYKAW